MGENSCLKDFKYNNGYGKAIIEILNIGFEPLLTESEYEIYKKIRDLKKKINNIKCSVSFIKSKLIYVNESKSYYSWLIKNLNECEDEKSKYRKEIKENEKKFRKALENNTEITRKLYENREFTSESQFRNIAAFESNLTRCFDCKDMEHSGDIISVVTYYTEIFKSIINNGFDYKEKHFVFFTAGAGQIRHKKSTFVSEDKLKNNFNKLFCGLTKEEINRQGGMNTNKYLAYTSLCQTNSEVWRDFDIDRAIVVEDIEFELPNQEVRFIYTESPDDKALLEELETKLKNVSEEIRILKKHGKDRFKEKALINYKKDIICEIEKLRSKYHSINIQKTNVKIPFTDGFGISLKKTQSAMIRLPFIKGLIAYCPKRAFQEWCGDSNIKIHRITDIYGKKHSIKDIDYIFTKSQFKMWKYYSNEYDKNGALVRTGWEVYKDNFKKYKCEACRCNVEDNVKLNAKTNYQILQTLTTEMSDYDIHSIANYDINCLNGIGENVRCMLNILGANEKKNDNLNWFQKSLILYPEMLKDFYVKTLLKNTKNSMIKKFRSGKFNINGSYVFAVPDTLACMQWWFTDIDKSNLENFGFVKKGHVSCALFEDKEKLDCLRSPHLDHAHCIRKNQIRKSDKGWIKSKSVYIGMSDIMSRLLMYDNDGDKLLVHNNKTIIKCAENFQKKYGIIPNYYDMPKANPQEINNNSLFEGIVNAYHHGNIGTPSNEITKIWASLNTKSKADDIKKAIDIISLRCLDVNFTIDYAKTLYKPEIPKHILDKYKIYSGKKVPHFFIYAKGKTEKQVEKISGCNIDRITKIVKSGRVAFKDLPDKYSYKKLMSNPDIDINTEKARKILELYRDIENTNLRKLSHIDFSILNIEEKKRILLQMQFDTNKKKHMFTEITGESEKYIADVLIKLLQKDINKDTLWRLFGEVIYNNLKTNLKGTKICEKCGKRFTIDYSVGKPKSFCEKCSKENKLNKWIKYYKNSKRNTNITQKYTI